MLEEWLRKLQGLRVDRASKTPAPHKPLLLLAILDFIESGKIVSPIVKLTPELAFQFLGYWEAVGARGRAIGRVELPFFHLQTDGILRHVAHKGLDVALASIRPTSVELLNRVISHAELPAELFNLMLEPHSRNLMRRVLVNADWFLSEEREKLNSILGIEDEYATVLSQTSPNVGNSDAVRQGRDIRFRLQIVPIYGYACLLCGIKMLLPSGITLVEAAHIHQFAKSKNDDVKNGMALCRNHHWAFDQGLWTIDKDFQVIVATDMFTEEAPNQLLLGAYNGRRLDFSHLASCHHPSQEHIEWHRKSRFVGNAA